MGDGHHDLVDRRHDAVDPLSAVFCRIDADRQRDRDHDQKRNDCHDDRDRQLGHDHIRHRHMILVRSPEITADKMHQPLQIPLQKRSVQPQLLPQRREALRRGVRSEGGERRISRYQVKSKIDEERDTQKRDDHGSQLFPNVSHISVSFYFTTI